MRSGRSPACGVQESICPASPLSGWRSAHWLPAARRATWCALAATADPGSLPADEARRVLDVAALVLGRLGIGADRPRASGEVRAGRGHPLRRDALLDP